MRILTYPNRVIVVFAVNQFTKKNPSTLTKILILRSGKEQITKADLISLAKVIEEVNEIYRDNQSV